MEFDLSGLGEGHEGPGHDHPQPSPEELMREFATIGRAGPLAACDVMRQFQKEGTELWEKGAASIGIDLNTPEGVSATYGYVMGLVSSLLAMGPGVSAQLDAQVQGFHHLTHITKSAVQWCREHDVEFPIVEQWERDTWNKHYASQYGTPEGQ